MKRSLCGLTIVTLGICASRPALAYCRTTACSSDPDACPDGAGPTCAPITDTNPALNWPTPCVHYVVNEEGEPDQGITAEDVEQAVATAVETWSSADCMPDTPPIVGQFRGQVACGEPEFDCADKSRNLNTVMFTSDWPHNPSALALTTITANLKTGDILDADMELNSEFFDFTVAGSGTRGDADLLSVVTHEMGHFLGLDHTPVSEATMFASYNPSTSDITNLDADDMEGICEIYGSAVDDADCPELSSVEGRECTGGSECPQTTSDSGGCSVAPVSSRSPSGMLWLMAAACVLCERRLRHRPR